MRFLFLLLFSALISRGHFVEAATVIPSTRLVTWQGNVGVTGGIPDSSLMTVFQTLGSTATLAQVHTALANCPSNQVVALLAGTYNWSGNFDFQDVGNGKVLRGATNANGWATTEIVTPSTLFLIRSIADETLLSTDANLTADAHKGDTTISIATPSWVTIGGIIGIDQLDDTTISFEPGQEAGDSYRHAMGNGDRGMAFQARVTATNSTSITFDTPLPADFTTALTAQIFKPFVDPGAFRQRIGIENIIVRHTGSGTTDNHMFKLETAKDCWLKNVVGTNLVGGIYVFGQGSYRCEVRHCRFDDSKSLGGGQGYGVGLYNFCTQWLIEDNIFRKLHVAMQNNYGSSYNVFVYNFETDGQSDSGQNPGMSGHGTTGYMTLFEGNWCMDKFLGDFTHGAGCYYTVFRNRIVGKNPAQSSDQTPISNERYNRKPNFVGNLLGSSGYHTNYAEAPSGTGYPGAIVTANCSDKSIYKFGFWANIGCTTTATDNFATMDPLIALNYDVVTSTNGGIVGGGFVTSDLVSSYYVSSKPSYFGQCPWPPFSPTSTSAASMDATNIPAGYRFTFNVDPPASGGGGGGGSGNSVGQSLGFGQAIGFGKGVSN